MITYRRSYIYKFSHLIWNSFIIYTKKHIYKFTCLQYIYLQLCSLKITEIFFSKSTISVSKLKNASYFIYHYVCHLLLSQKRYCSSFSCFRFCALWIYLLIILYEFWRRKFLFWTKIDLVTYSTSIYTGILLIFPYNFWLKS